MTIDSPLHPNSKRNKEQYARKTKNTLVWLDDTRFIKINKKGDVVDGGLGTRYSGESYEAALVRRYKATVPQSVVDLNHVIFGDQLSST